MCQHTKQGIPLALSDSKQQKVPLPQDRGMCKSRLEDSIDGNPCVDKMKKGDESLHDLR